MDTTQTPIDLDDLLDRYFEPDQSLHNLARHLGISLRALSAFLEQPHVKQAIRDIRRMFRRRTPHLIEATLERNLQLINAAATLPENPTPADRDRLRRELDTSRRVADLMRRMGTSPPRQRSSRQASPHLPTHFTLPSTPTDTAVETTAEPTAETTAETTADATPISTPSTTPSTPTARLSDAEFDQTLAAIEAKIAQALKSKPLHRQAS
jgi:hypothetical protein